MECFDSWDAERVTFVLNGLRHIGPRNFLKIIRVAGKNLSGIFSMTCEELQNKFNLSKEAATAIAYGGRNFDVESQTQKADAMGARFISYFSENYPQALRETSDPPIGLHAVGKELLGKKWVAVVGTRSCSHHGEMTAFNLSRRLAERGYGVVSGLAIGIDMAAHSGALAGGGHTAAVLGCGLDIVYPQENADLRRKIVNEGTVLSEFPFGRRADRGAFAIRNRIITGLSDATIVVETDVTGGSMLSADFAREQNKPLFAVPGRIGDPCSAGCLKLIRSGVATLLSDVEDVFEILENQHHIQRQLPLSLDFGLKKMINAQADLNTEEKRVLDALRGRPQSVEEIAKQIGIETLQCSCLLQKLRVRGAMDREASGIFCERQATACEKFSV
jgi:DNA processing protein